MEKFCLKNIYSRLGDEESRFLFEKRLNWSLTGDMQRMIYSINRDMNQKKVYYEKLIKTPKEIFLFGAGISSHLVVKAFPEIHWSAFIDNDDSKVDKSDILPIISFQKFIANSDNAMVFIASSIYSAEMKQQLVSNGFPEDSIIQSFTHGTYFDLPYFKPQNNEFFIDAGGYDGSTTKNFFEWMQNNNVSGGRSIVFEPNPVQYPVCKNNSRNYNNVEVVNKGLWNKKETIGFCKKGEGSRIISGGEETIEVVSLDEYLKDEKEPVTFIKMDIEGAELNALKGTKRIITEQKPKLAICIYHKPEDIWEIPSLLLEFTPDYKFYIRHYFWSHLDTILYAL